MKKLLFIVLALFLLPGCAWLNGLFGSDGGGSHGGKRPASKPSSSSPRQELSDSRASFDEKIKAAVGQNLKQVKKEWGELETGLSQGDLTVYRWSQTAKVTTPAGETMPASNTGQQTTSCLAMFIVSGDGRVVDATSEGQCFDYSLMPSWKPVIVESTDGKTGPVHR